MKNIILRLHMLYIDLSIQPTCVYITWLWLIEAVSKDRVKINIKRLCWTISMNKMDERNFSDLRLWDIPKSLKCKEIKDAIVNRKLLFIKNIKYE